MIIWLETNDITLKVLVPVRRRNTLQWCARMLSLRRLLSVKCRIARHPVRCFQSASLVTRSHFFAFLYISDAGVAYHGLSDRGVRTHPLVTRRLIFRIRR